MEPCAYICLYHGTLETRSISTVDVITAWSNTLLVTAIGDMDDSRPKQRIMRELPRARRVKARRPSPKMLKARRRDLPKGKGSRPYHQRKKSIQTQQQKEEDAGRSRSITDAYRDRVHANQFCERLESYRAEKSQRMSHVRENVKQRQR